MAAASEGRTREPQHQAVLAELLPLAIHALAQPVNILQGYCELLPRIDDRSGQREKALAAITDASERLADILGDLRRAASSEDVAHALVRRYGQSSGRRPTTGQTTPHEPEHE